MHACERTHAHEKKETRKEKIKQRRGKRRETKMSSPTV